MTDRSEPTTAADRCQTWGAYSGRRCMLQQSHEGRHFLEAVIGEPLAIEAEARQPDSTALRLLRARIDAEPFFPKGDGPSIGNAAAFRDYKRRILAALPSNVLLSERIDKMSEAEFEAFGKRLDGIAAEKVARIRTALPPSDPDEKAE